MASVYYKFLDDQGRSSIDGEEWFLPRAGAAGDWMPKVCGVLSPYTNGYLIYTRDHMVPFVDSILYECEYRGEATIADGRLVVREVRLLREVESWNDTSRRLFMVDCAEHVTHLFDRNHPGYFLTRHMIEQIRRFSFKMSPCWRGSDADHALYSVFAAHRPPHGPLPSQHAADAAALAGAEDGADVATDPQAIHARMTEKNWQTERLWQYIDGKVDINAIREGLNMPIPEDTAELEQRITDLEAEIEKKSEECDSLHRLMAAFGAMYANLVSCGTEPPVINQGGCKDANVEE